jgi:hypothetical protein
MQSFEIFGIPLILLKYSGDVLDTAQSIPASILNPPTRTFLHFSGGVTAFLAGAALIGGTSGATAYLQSTVITSGTLGTSDAVGIAFLENIVGIFQAGENLTITGPSTLAVARSAVITLPPWATEAVSLWLQAETNDIRISNVKGQSPTTSTASGLVSFGLVLSALASVTIKGPFNVANTKFINAVAASNGVVNAIVYYGGTQG